MVNHKEILRLKHLGLTNREIAHSAGCGRNTVTRTLARAREQQLGWQQAQSMKGADFTSAPFRLSKNLVENLCDRAAEGVCGGQKAHRTFSQDHRHSRWLE